MVVVVRGDDGGDGINMILSSTVYLGLSLLMRTRIFLIRFTMHPLCTHQTPGTPYPKMVRNNHHMAIT